MKTAVIIFLMMGGMLINQLSAQEKEDVKREVVLKKVDAQSKMAFVYEDEVLVEKGLLKNGKREGVWQSFNTNGTLTAEASFSNGERNGIWVIYEGDDVKYILHYQNNSRVKAIDLARAE
jgi:antitoxin component YwqK of YwqJK toxin-antitoxin module